MQDIVPIKRKNKKLKITLIVLGIILAVLLVVTVTYLITKNSSKGESQEEQTQEVIEEKPEEEGDFVYVTTKSGLNMRSGTSTEHDIVYTLPYGEKLKIEDKNEEEDWYKTTFEEVTGWFFAEYTSIEEPEDETADWKLLSINKELSYSLKYPTNWRKEGLGKDNAYDFKLVPKIGGFTEIYIEVSTKSVSDLKKEMLDSDHVQAGSMTFAIAGIKGTKIVVQTLKNNKVVYTEDVIFLEKDNKTIKIVGPADGEDDGDKFNLLIWTLQFEGDKNEEV